MTFFAAALVKLALPFFTLFASFFQDPFIYNDWYQKSSKWEPPNAPKSTKTAKSQHQNAPTVKTCKKTPSGRGQTSEIDDSYTLSYIFPKAQRSQKGCKMEAKIEPQGTQNQKEQKTITSTQRNSTKQHCKKWVTAAILI